MDKFDIGGKIVLSDNEKYIILDIVNQENDEYYFCSTDKKPIIPVIFKRVEKEGKIFVEQIKDNELIKYILYKIIKK